MSAPSPLLRLIPSALPFIFSTIAFGFSLAAITSYDWAHQNHYDPRFDQTTWNPKKPIFILQRSPFVDCEGASKDSLSCHRYRAFGNGTTSCETLFVTKNWSAAVDGDERFCQQVHWTGNLAITSTTFIGLAFLITLIATGLILVLTFGSHSNTSTPSRVVATSESVAEEKPATTSPNQQATAPQSLVLPYLNLFLILFAVIGAFAGYVSQFYGIMAFVQSQPDNGAFAVAKATQADITSNDAHSPWIQGRALSSYVTVAWVFSAAAATAAALVWRLPRVTKMY